MPSCRASISGCLLAFLIQYAADINTYLAVSLSRIPMTCPRGPMSMQHWNTDGFNFSESIAYHQATRAVSVNMCNSSPSIEPEWNLQVTEVEHWERSASIAIHQMQVKQGRYSTLTEIEDLSNFHDTVKTNCTLCVRSTGQKWFTTGSKT